MNFVGMYPINVKTVEPIGSYIFVATHMNPGKVNERPKVKHIAWKKLVFLEIRKILSYNHDKKGRLKSKISTLKKLLNEGREAS